MPEPVLARDQDVLRGPAAKLHGLELACASAAEGHFEAGLGRALPDFLGRRGEHGEGDFDAPRILGRFAAMMNELGDNFVARRFERREWELAECVVVPLETVIFPDQAVGVLRHVGERKPAGHFLLEIGQHQDKNAAPRPAGSDTEQPPRGRLVKLRGKLATTRKRNGSATSPAISLYASIVGYSLRRYF